jgi:hypothetical protein
MTGARRRLVIRHSSPRTGILVGDGDGGEAKAKEKAPDSDGQSAAVGAVGAAAKALRWERWERRRQRRRDFESLARKRLH